LGNLTENHSKLAEPKPSLYDRSMAEAHIPVACHRLLDPASSIDSALAVRVAEPGWEETGDGGWDFLIPPLRAPGAMAPSKRSTLGIIPD
jgi:hypothetical protein